MHLGPIVYKILFNDEPENLPNPNLPENVPRIKAMTKARDEKFRRFWKNEGAVLFERWQDKIRENVFDLLITEEDCNCKTCNKIKEIATIVKLLSEAQLILSKE
jgi:hypothetical protein